MNVFDDEAELETDQTLLWSLMMLAEAGLTLTQVRVYRTFTYGGC